LRGSREEGPAAGFLSENTILTGCNQPISPPILPLEFELQIAAHHPLDFSRYAKSVASLLCVARKVSQGPKGRVRMKPQFPTNSGEELKLIGRSTRNLVSPTALISQLSIFTTALFFFEAIIARPAKRDLSTPRITITFPKAHAGTPIANFRRVTRPQKGRLHE
jgi:hypothetical protein